MFRNTNFCSSRFFCLTRCVVAVLAVGALLIPGPVQAQSGSTPDWNKTSDPVVNAVGLHYGQIGGHGLSFRVPVRWWLYVQVAGGVWHTDNKQDHNFGFNFNYILRQDQRLRIFVSGGTAFFHSKETFDSVGDQESYNLQENWNVGGGVGIEYLQGLRWAWKVEADFAHLGKSGDIKVVPQVGIAYYW